mgnify:CR=1 FL=1
MNSRSCGNGGLLLPDMQHCDGRAAWNAPPDCPILLKDFCLHINELLQDRAAIPENLIASPH